MPELFGRQVPRWVIPAGASLLALIVILVLVLTVFTGDEGELTAAAPTRAPSPSPTLEPSASPGAQPKATRAPAPTVAPTAAPGVAPASAPSAPVVTPAPPPDQQAPVPTPAPEETPVPAAEFFHHTATAANSSGNYTVINAELTNNKPNALVFVTHNWNPLGGDGVYNDYPLGVWYTGSQWTIFNEAFTPEIPQGAVFNVQVRDPGPNAFVHTSTGANTSADLTVIDNPATNGKPNVVLIVTPNLNPNNNCSCVYNEHPIGVFYDGSKWGIFNEDAVAMPANVQFNVLVLDPGPGVFVHDTTDANKEDNYTTLDNAATNEKPSVGVFVTQLYAGSRNQNNVGVFRYDDPLKWAVFNENTGNAIPSGADFHVQVLTGS